MDKKAVGRGALVVAALGLLLVLDACACRPLRVGVAGHTPPTTVGQLEASLQWYGVSSADHRATESV